MKGKRVATALLGSLATIGMVRHAAADCSAELEVAPAGGPHIRIYSQTGQYLGEIDRGLAAHRPAMDCDESYGLIEVELTDHRLVWIRRREATALHEKTCLANADANAKVPVPGNRIAGTSGAGGSCP